MKISKIFRQISQFFLRKITVRRFYQKNHLEIHFYWRFHYDLNRRTRLKLFAGVDR